MPTIIKRGRRFRVQWREGGRGSALRSATFGTRTQAQAWAAQVQARQAATRPVRRGTPLAWHELVGRYVASRAKTTLRHRQIAERTLLRLGQAHGWATVGDLSPATLGQPGQLACRLLRALLRFAADLDQAPDLRLLRLLRPPQRVRRPPTLLSDAQVQAVVAAAEAWHPADGALVHLIATYGHRAQSLVGLTWADLDLDADPPTITMPLKSGDLHRHPLLPATVARLRALRPSKAQPGDAVLVGHLGRPWAHGSEVAGWMAHSLRPRAGVLDLRRYAITRMLAAGHDARTVASITGHRTPSLLLDTYARTTQDRQRQVLESLAVMPGDASKSHKPLTRL